MALPTCYFLDADNADDTDLLSFYPYHPRYLFLKGILLKVLMRFPVFIPELRKALSDPFRNTLDSKVAINSPFLVCYIYLIATRASADIAFACFGKESISGAAGTQESNSGRERES